MEIVKNFSLTDRIGGNIMYENDNFSGYETGDKNTTGTFSGVTVTPHTRCAEAPVAIQNLRTPKSMEVISGKLW